MKPRNFPGRKQTRRVAAIARSENNSPDLSPRQKAKGITPYARNANVIIIHENVKDLLDEYAATRRSKIRRG